MKTVLVTFFHLKSSVGSFCFFFFSHGWYFPAWDFTSFALAPITICHETYRSLAAIRPEESQFVCFSQGGDLAQPALRHRRRCSADPLFSAQPARSSGLGATLDGWGRVLTTAKTLPCPHPHHPHGRSLKPRNIAPTSLPLSRHHHRKEARWVLDVVSARNTNTQQGVVGPFIQICESRMLEFKTLSFMEIFFFKFLLLLTAWRIW